MPSPFGDDERFPERPDVPDFWRLSDVVLQFDGASGEGDKTLEQVAEGRIDMNALAYMGAQRVAMLVARAGLPHSPELLAALHTVFTTSVLTGIEFERKGGHRA